MHKATSILLSFAVICFIGTQLAECSSNCAWYYPQSDLQDREYSSSFRSPTIPVIGGTYLYFYYNAKADVDFRVTVTEYTESPRLAISRSSKHLKPIALEAEYNGDSYLSISRPQKECYVIAVYAGYSHSESFAITLVEEGSSEILIPPPIQKSCREFFPSLEAPEYQGSSSFNVTHRPRIDYEYVFFRAKARVPFSISLLETVGKTYFAVSRSVGILKPAVGFAQYTSTTGDSISIDPKASECFSIAVINHERNPVRMQIKELLPGPDPLPSKPETLEPVPEDSSDPDLEKEKNGVVAGESSKLVLILGLVVGISLVIAFSIAAVFAAKRTSKKAEEGTTIPLAQGTASEVPGEVGGTIDS